jgi:hypothetical protein
LKPVLALIALRKLLDKKNDMIKKMIIDNSRRRTMPRYRRFLTVPICLSILLSAIGSYAEEEIEDLVDVFESNRKIIAVIEKRTFTSNLRSKEKVLWSDSDGYLGAFLTNERFFVISTSSGAWKYLPLKSDESKGVASLSPYIALLVAGDRAIVFNEVSNRFIEKRLPIQDELLTAKVERYVAVVVTSSRAFDFTTRTSAFNEIPFRGGETFEEIKATSSKATIRTSDRLLTFNAKSSTWNEHRLY